MDRVERDNLKRRLRSAAERGMTLLEVMVVLTIIGLIMGVVGVAVLGRLEKAREKVAFTQIARVSEAVELYKLSYRRYPSTAEGLQALTQSKGGEAPIMNSIPQDPWGHDYVYISPGSHNTSAFDIMSYGPDGVEGGADDIGNWQQPGAEKQQ